MPKCHRHFWRNDTPLFYHLFGFWQRESDSCSPNIVLTFLSPNCYFYLSLEIIVGHFDPTIKFESNCFWTNKNIQNSECKYNSTFGIASAPLHYTVFINYYMTYILKPLHLNPILLSEFVQNCFDTGCKSITLL
jgi:hypothetical protein